jgi:hypothetical protein
MTCVQFIKSEGPPHAIFALDVLRTTNEGGDEGVEAGATPFLTINTGVHFVKQVRV